MQNGKINYWTKQQSLQNREQSLRDREDALRRRELALANRLNADEMKKNPDLSPEVRSEIHKLADRIVEKAYNPMKPVTIKIGINKSPVKWNGSKVRRGVQAYSEDVQDPSCVTPTGKLRSGIKTITPFGRMKAKDAEPKTPAVAECFDINSRATDILKRKLEKQRTRYAIKEAASKMIDDGGRMTNDEPSAKTLVRPTMKDYSKQYSTAYFSDSERGINMTVDLPRPAVPLPRISVDTAETMNSVAKQTLTRNSRASVPGQKPWNASLRNPKKPVQNLGPSSEYSGAI